MKNTIVRRTVAGVAAATALAALTACGSTEKSATDNEGATASGPFTYTDARGEKIALDEKPDQVVAQSSVAAALWDAGFKVQGVYGELGQVDGKLDYQAGNLDLAELKVLGKTYGEFDEVAYAAMKPDVLIDFNMAAKDLWYVPAKKAKSIYAMAPAIGLNGQQRTDTDAAIEEVVALAEELGADTGSAEHEEAKEAYEKAVASVGTAAKGKESVKVMLVSPSLDGLYVWNPKMMPEAVTMAEQGVTFIEPKNTKDSAGWSELLSWENAGTYDADVILFDSRMQAEYEKVKGIATWKTLPAVKAGQVYPWRTAAPYSYAQYGPIFDEVADWLADVKALG